MVRALSERGADYLDLLNGGIVKPSMLLECAGYVDDQGVRRGVLMSNSGIKIKKESQLRSRGGIR